MASVINIYNMALTKIGVTQRVASLAEETEQRRTCALWYEQCRDQVLRTYPWAFARTVEALALLTETAPPGWAYAYAYPAECLQARTVTTSAGARLSIPPLWSDVDAFQYNGTRIPFDVQYSPASLGQIIATDVSDAYLVYTRRISDTLLFDSLFTNALACLLAKEVGSALRAEARLVQQAGSEYSQAIAYAAAMTQNERVGDVSAQSPSITVR